MPQKALPAARRGALQRARSRAGENGGAGAPCRYFFAAFERLAVDLDEERELVFLALVLADFAAARGFAAEVLEPRAFEAPDVDGVADLALPLDFVERADDFDAVADFEPDRDFEAEDLAAPAFEVPPLERPAFVPLDLDPPVERVLALVLPLPLEAEPLPDFDPDDFEADDFEALFFDPLDFGALDLEPLDLEALDLEALDLEALDFGVLDFVLDLAALDLEPPVAPEAPAGLVAPDCEALERVPPVERRAPPELFAPMPDEPPIPEAAAPIPEPAEPMPDDGFMPDEPAPIPEGPEPMPEEPEPMPEEPKPMPEEPKPMPEEPEAVPEEPEPVVPDMGEASAMLSLSRRAVSVTLCAAPVIRFLTRAVVVGVVLLAIETASPTGPTSWAVRSKLGA
jgi:hypothetical protein